jgi:hypothetical protein
MRDILRILLSKAVILTYLFIGYVAITDKDTPVNVSDSVPSFSVNTLSYPSATVIQISTTEHLRSAKFLADHGASLSAEIIDFSVFRIAFSGLCDHVFIPPYRILTRFHQGRAPPSV